MAQSDPWIETLDRAGYFVTGARRTLAEMLVGRSGHFTARDLVREARVGRLSIGRATIFRSLEIFESIGLVERLDLPNGGHAYVVCQAAHHHHIVCTGCGRTAEVGDLGLAALRDDLESQTGFALDSHRIELYGRCAACRAGVAAAEQRTAPVAS